jgi:hypothetical protein
MFGVEGPSLDCSICGPRPLHCLGDPLRALNKGALDRIDLGSRDRRSTSGFYPFCLSLKPSRGTGRD